MKQIKDLAVKVYGMTDDELQSLFETTEDGEKLKDDAIDVIAKKDAERVKSLQKRLKDEHKTELTEKWNEAYSEAKKKERQKLEQEIKEKYGIETDKFGVDLVDEVVSLAAKRSDDIKTHPDYLKLERQLQSDYVPKTEYEKVRQEFEEYNKAVAREKVISRVTEDARKVFRGLNPILSQDPKRAANQEADFLRKLQGLDYELQDDGNHVILKDGKRLENENMNAITLPDFVKTMTLEYFDVAEQNTKGGAGVQTQTGFTATWKSKDEFLSAYGRETDPAKRIQMMDAAKAKGVV